MTWPFFSIFPFFPNLRANLVDVSFFAAVLLFVNALAVLNEQRLLQKSTPPPIYLFILWQLTSLLNMCSWVGL